jgi:predicted ABC-type ATPase
VPPRIFIIAGPPGGGKSTAFPVSGFGVDFFNADDQAAALNRGSYLSIARAVRIHVNRLFEGFVLEHIERRVSFALETTLRSEITSNQADLTRGLGFVVEMRYVALHTFGLHLQRVKMRADQGGHSAPEAVLREIYESSMSNLARAIREMDFIRVYDNSGWGVPPTVMLQAEKGEIIYQARRIPGWLAKALKQR